MSKLCLTPRGLALLVALLCACGAVSAQADPPKRPMTENLLATLHRVGLPVAEIIAAVERNGVATELDHDGVRRLVDQGLPAAVIAKVEAAMTGRRPAQVTVQDVIAMHETGIPVHVIRERIVASPARIEHDADDVIELAAKGVPAALIRAIREHDPEIVANIERGDGTVTLDDLAAMAKLKLSGDQMLERIRRADARFSVVIDDLIRLSRDQVPQEVINEVWARRILPGSTTAPENELPAAAVAQPTETAPALESLLIHREPAGGFSLVVPAGWHAFRDTSGRNELLSLSDTPATEGTALANSEIQVLRVRAKDGEADRIVPQNLDSIAKNFLARLQANYAAKKMTLAAGPSTPGEVSGQPAIFQRLSSTDADGTTHEGELAVTFKDGVVVLITYAIRADLFAVRGPVLQSSIRSFTFEDVRAPLEVGAEPREQLRALFDHWLKAIQRRDYGLWRQLLPADQDTPARRREFTDLATRLDQDGLELKLATVELDEPAGKGSVHCRVIAKESAETIVIEFARTQQGFRLK